MTRSLIVIASILIATSIAANDYYSACENAETGEYQLQQGRNYFCSAWGKFNEKENSSGWNELYIESSRSIVDWDKAYAAGFLEGALTRDHIANWWTVTTELGNLVVYNGNKTLYQLTRNWVKQNMIWAGDQVDANLQDPYWQHVGYILAQIDGMRDGYEHNRRSNQPKLSFEDFYFMNSFPDSLDLVYVVVPQSERPDPFKFTEKEMQDFKRKSLHCSVLIKPLQKELFASHTTWIFFSMLDRIFKHIKIPFTTAVSQSVSFSSYPVQIASSDDFYKLDTGLVVMETTNNIFNMQLYDQVPISSLMSWTRTTLANRLALTGTEWAAVFGEQNSGTYNCQWMIVNYNVFTHSQVQTSGLVTIVEQIPGLIQSADVSSVVKQQGFWSSYNVPYFPTIFNESGYPAFAQKFPNSFSYENCFRSQIFKRDAPNVVDLASMQKLAQYNDFQADPICGTTNDPSCAISDRGDLDPKNPAPFGGIDSKIASISGFNDGTVMTTCGPTHETLAPFQWSDYPQFSMYPHPGQPNTWQFNWFQTSDGTKLSE